MKTKPTDIIKVVESREVTYKKKGFLFFKWWKQESSYRIGTKLIIETNDIINDIYLNGKQII